MGLPLPLATCLSWVGPPSNLGGGSARAVFLLVSQKFLAELACQLPKFCYWGPRDPGPPGHPGGLARWVDEFQSCSELK